MSAVDRYSEVKTVNENGDVVTALMPKFPWYTFGQVLAAYRAARGWSQYRLAEEAEIDDSYVSRLERGERLPARKVVEKLIVGLGLEGDEANAFRLAAWDVPR